MRQETAMMRWLARGLAMALVFFGSLGWSAADPVTQCVSNAQAGGTVNAITIPLLPCGLATNLLLLTSQGTNTTSGPTLQMTGYAALPIHDSTGGVLGAGALPPVGGVVLLTSLGTEWRILAAGGLGPSGTSLSVKFITGGAYTALITDQMLLVNNSPAQAMTITLPAKSNWPTCPTIAQSCPTFIIKDAAGTFSTVATNVVAADGALFDAAYSTYGLPFNYQEQEFTLNGSGWSVR